MYAFVSDLIDAAISEMGEREKAEQVLRAFRRAYSRRQSRNVLEVEGQILSRVDVTGSAKV